MPGVGICDRSGFKYPLEELVKQWDGAMVHRRFLDHRHPQDFVRGVADKQRLPFTRPEAADVFIAQTFTTEGGVALLTEDGQPLITEDGVLPVRPEDL
jgi:hypothetical protein